MERPLTPKQYYEDFRARLVAAREAKKLSQTEMADLLQVPRARYQKFEYRDRFPLYLIPRLAAATDRSIEYWVTGKNVRHMREYTPLTAAE